MSNDSQETTDPRDAEIDRLRAEVARLREALLEIAKCGTEPGLCGAALAREALETPAPGSTEAI